MKKTVGVVALVLLMALPGLAKEKSKVEMRGTLHTGIVAIGGETTGTEVATKEGTFELDFGKNKDLLAKAEKLNGKMVVVEGILTVKPGVEIKQRKIIAVSSLRKADE